MIKRIKSSLTIKICLLMMVLLIASSGITYGAVAGFLPAYYSSQLEADLDTISKEMAETISSHKSIEEAANVIELFQAGSHVLVVILDEDGAIVWPQADEDVEETAFDSEAAGEAYLDNGTADSCETAVQTEDAETLVQEMPNEAAAKKEQVVSDEEEQAANVWETADQEDSTWEETIQFQDQISGIVLEEITTEDDVQNAARISELLQTDDSVSAVKHYALEVGDRPYTMLVSGGMQPVNQAMGILKEIFPYILGIAIVMAVLFALGTSFYLTAPVVRLSQLSRKMTALDFSGVYTGHRTDEIGILGSNLNEMSENLSRTLKELQQANAKLKSDIEMEREIEQKRIAFFSAVSHELKTPITILKGHLTGMIQGIGAYRDRDYYLKRSEETAEKMEDMVQELLTVSRIESRTFTLQQTDLAEQLRLQLAELTELIEEKKLGLAVDIPEHLNVQVNYSMIEKVFRNLLTNAIRYTPEGGGNQIRVYLHGNKNIICTVENTGVHIPEEDLPHLFEAFYRVEQSRNRQTGGSGLGLYIVKMALEQHGAEYRMENTEEGVKFSFSLPSDCHMVSGFSSK